MIIIEISCFIFLNFEVVALLVWLFGSAPFIRVISSLHKLNFAVTLGGQPVSFREPLVILKLDTKYYKYENRVSNS